MSALEEVYAEMRRAKEKHGDAYMANQPERVHPDHVGIVVYEDQVLRAASNCGVVARFLNDHGHPTKVNVFLEEVGELADDLIAGRDHRAELVQVAAMALAWLGVDPT